MSHGTGEGLRSRRSADVRAWLQSRPTLDAMRAEFPHEWTQVEAELAEVVDSGDPKVLEQYVQQLARGGTGKPSARGAKPTRSGIDAALAAQVRRAMAAESIRHLSVRASSGVKSGRVRFNLVNAWIAQRLLFDGSGLRRKPVSMGAFRVLWPLLWQRKRLMPLVEPKGIYCFYSKPLVKRLAALIGDRTAIEVAAGDGTLARFLRDAGADVTATDDHSWSAVDFPADVERMDAAKAVKQYAPQVVLCSWPPEGNTFERAILAAPSVETYVVIGTGTRVGAGDRDAYVNATGFTERDPGALSALVLPPELGSVVRVFDRTDPSA